MNYKVVGGHLEQFFFDSKFMSGVEVPFFLYSVFGALDADFEYNDETRNTLYENIIRWHLGEFGPYWNGGKLKYWPQYSKIESYFLSSHSKGLTPLLTNGMMHVSRVKTELQEIFDLSSIQGQRGLVHWALTSGIFEFPFIGINPQIKAEIFELKNEYIVEELLLILAEGDLNLKRKLGEDGLESLKTWWWEEGQSHYEYLRDKLPSNASSAPGASKLSITLGNSNGVNVLGYLSAKTGLGEDCRMIMRVLSHANIPYHVVDLEHLKLNGGINLPYKVNLFTVPATDHFKKLMFLGPEVLRNKINIGAWQWELSSWPKAYEEFFKVVDEVWTISSYVRGVIGKDSTVPVVTAPLAVEVPNIDIVEAKKLFNVDPDVFTFLVMFDGKSSIYRKNPIAAVKAFYKAFSRENASVQLIIKCMSISEKHPLWREIQDLILGDTRVRVINESLPDKERFKLIASCDAFVSPHRSEGFGRIIAEAMLYEKPVIVTGYSGNLDFTNEENSYVVEGTCVPLREGEYLNYTNQKWFNPDIDCLAFKMAECFDDPVKREEKARNGKALVLQSYSVAKVSEFYLKNLTKFS